jgi:hypothetical protein
MLSSQTCPIFRLQTWQIRRLHQAACDEESVGIKTKIIEIR